MSAPTTTEPVDHPLALRLSRAAHDPNCDPTELLVEAANAIQQMASALTAADQAMTQWRTGQRCYGTLTAMHDVVRAALGLEPL